MQSFFCFQPIYIQYLLLELFLISKKTLLTFSDSFAEITTASKITTFREKSALLKLNTPKPSYKIPQVRENVFYLNF